MSEFLLIIMFELLQDNFFASFFLGWGVTTVSGICAYPFDTLRRRMMLTSGQSVKYRNTLHALREIIHHEGVSALFRGVTANILLGVAGAGVLAGYDKLHRIAYGHGYRFESHHKLWHRNVYDSCTCTAPVLYYSKSVNGLKLLEGKIKVKFVGKLVSLNVRADAHYWGFLNCIICIVLPDLSMELLRVYPKVYKCFLVHINIILLVHPGKDHNVFETNHQWVGWRFICGRVLEVRSVSLHSSCCYIQAIPYWW